MKIINIVGARPNFMKIAPIVEEMKKHSDIHSLLVHTGQHYDEKMSQVFFEDLGMPEPDIYLGVGSGSHAEQTAKIMIEFEKVCMNENPDLIVVVGDVNSTLACSVVASKLWIPIAHVEAGLRSRDRYMPEEINRIVTDALSDLLFTTSRDADENLLKEGVPQEKIHFVGNVMIDSLMKHRQKARSSTILERLGFSDNNGSETRNYAVLTLHRPSNVDDKDILHRILDTLKSISQDIPIVFPIHPRTQKQIGLFGFESYLSWGREPGDIGPGIHCLEPIGYLDFLNLVANSTFVMSDSGGIQEETTVLGVPCLTLRENTERPITEWEGTNIVVGSDPERILEEAQKAIHSNMKRGRTPELWDGKAAKRIVDICRKFCL